MRIRLLGLAGLKVSEICLGAVTFGSVPGGRRLPGCDEAASLAVLNGYLEQGGNFLDTADGYADGRSEEILGKTVSQVALALILAMPGATSAIIGARNLAQLRDNLGARG